MSTRGSKQPLKGYVRDHRRRKMVLDVDLNAAPPGDNRAQEVATTSRGDNRAREVATTSRGDSLIEQVGGRGGALPASGRGRATTRRGDSLVDQVSRRGGPLLAGRIRTVPIDVEAIDDEVVISSPRSFLEARNQSRRNPVVTVVLDEDSDIHHGRSGAVAEEPITRLTLNSYNNRKRNSSNGTIINCELYINLEGSHSTKRKTVMKPQPEAQSSVLPKEPVFSCAICMGPLVEEMSTTCGHIFCKNCIKAAITAQKKCPTCRRKLTMNNIHRVYLPTTN
ncbi:uncharacterized protein LOC143847336 [Tasmannia lanceolata]|uniref:uncharacterized protein LOC143847336 n=1 Tax=Tasmannia lanceolata TaxID=3420 RepID=UPI00406437DE